MSNRMLCLRTRFGNAPMNCRDTVGLGQAKGRSSCWIEMRCAAWVLLEGEVGVLRVSDNQLGPRSNLHATADWN